MEKRISNLEKQQACITKVHDIQSQFNSLFHQIMKLLETECKDTLTGQIYSEHTVENLINDLLDLAKMENNSFTFTQEYFNLSQLIFEAFNMLKFQANQDQVTIIGEIDHLKSLDMIQSI